MQEHSHFSQNIQSLFPLRSKHATSHALIHTITNAFDNMDQNVFSAFLLFDLKKALDTVNHDILLRKLQHYGIRGIIHNLF